MGLAANTRGYRKCEESTNENSMTPSTRRAEGDLTETLQDACTFALSRQLLNGRRAQLSPSVTKDVAFSPFAAKLAVAPTSYPKRWEEESTLNGGVMSRLQDRWLHRGPGSSGKTAQV